MKALLLLSLFSPLHGYGDCYSVQVTVLPVSTHFTSCLPLSQGSVLGAQETSLRQGYLPDIQTQAATSS